MTSCKNGNKANDVLRAEKTKDGNVNWELQVKQFKAAWKQESEECSLFNGNVRGKKDKDFL